jgi:hypothetical protein
MHHLMGNGRFEPCRIEQILERTNPPTFLTLFNNAVITVNQLGGGGRGTQTDRQHGDLISLPFLFKESMLKIGAADVRSK